MKNDLPALTKRRPKNPTHVPRNAGFAWNASTIGAALNLNRETVRRKLNLSGLEPDGRVHNSPVWELSRAIPVLFGHPPKSPKP